jgi:hypothetical protein
MKDVSPARDGDAETDTKKPLAAPRNLTPAAARALAEAEARRRNVCAPAPREVNGREGPDPVRYGDWEVKGLASDF